MLVPAIVRLATHPTAQAVVVSLLTSLVQSAVLGVLASAVRLS